MYIYPFTQIKTMNT